MILFYKDLNKLVLFVVIKCEPVVKLCVLDC